MVLGKTLYGLYDQTLLTAYSILTAEKIERLKDLGIKGLFILEQFEDKGEVVQNLLEELQGIDIKELDANTMLEIATKVTYCVTESRNVNLTLLDLKEFDNYTYHHSVNVAIYACMIAKQLGYNTKQLISISLTGLLHDFGKLSVSKDVLNAARKLTKEEFDDIKKHPLIGYELLKDKEGISEDVKLGILQHHEEENGSGYPYHLKGDQISEFGKIIHVADVYDALVTRRVYKEPYSVQEAIEFLLASCGTKFDKRIVKIFIRCVPVYALGTKVLLSNNTKATVIANHNTLRPTVKLDSGHVLDLSNYETYNITIISADTNIYDLEDSKFNHKIILVSNRILNLQALTLLLGLEVTQMNILAFQSFRQKLKSYNIVSYSSIEEYRSSNIPGIDENYVIVINEDNNF